jgi:hypothetical protein
VVGVNKAMCGGQPSKGVGQAARLIPRSPGGGVAHGNYSAIQLPSPRLAQLKMGRDGLVSSRVSPNAKRGEPCDRHTS